jgi:hypothetical protein
MHICSLKFSTIYGEPEQRKLPLSNLIFSRRIILNFLSYKSMFPDLRVRFPDLRGILTSLITILVSIIKLIIKPEGPCLIACKKACYLLASIIVNISKCHSQN